MAKKAKKAVARKTSKVRKAAAVGVKKASPGNPGNRTKYSDDQKIKVVGEHKRREGSRFFSGYEALKKTGTVAAFRKVRPEDASELLRNAEKDGYIKVA